MKNEMDDLFIMFKGDFSSLAVYLFITKTNNLEVGGFTSLRDLSIQSGYSREKLKKILSRLKKMGLIDYKVTGQIGTTVVRNLTSTNTNLTSSSSNPLIRGELDKGLTQNGPSVIPEGNLRYTGLSNCIFNHKLTTQSRANDKQQRVKNDATQLTTSKRQVKLEASDLATNKRVAAATSLSKASDKTEKPTKRTPATTKSKKPAKKSLGAQIWDAYKEEFAKVYGFEPPSNAKNYSNTAMIGGRIGQDALQVVRFYVNHKDSWYIKNRHPIGFALKDIDRLYADWKIGRKISNEQAKKEELIDDSRTLLDEMLAEVDKEYS